MYGHLRHRRIGLKHLMLAKKRLQITNMQKVMNLQKQFKTKMQTPFKEINNEKEIVR